MHAIVMRDRVDEGVAGVVASVASLITGAADLRFTRLETGRSVEVELRHGAAMSPELIDALRRALGPVASKAEREAFARAWRARVAEMLAAGLSSRQGFPRRPERPRSRRLKLHVSGELADKRRRTS